MRQLLAVQIRCAGFPELAEVETLDGAFLDVEGLRYGEEEVARIVDFDYAAFPELEFTH